MSRSSAREAISPCRSRPPTGREIGPVDYVFLGIKAYSYASAGPLLATLLADHTAVIAAQNGIPWWYFHGHGGALDGRRIEAVDPDGAVSRTIGVERAIGCVVYCSTTIEAPGVIRHEEGTRFSLGEPDRTVSRALPALRGGDEGGRAEGAGRGRSA